MPTLQRTLILFLAAGAFAQAQKPGRALAIEDYYRVKNVGNPELSPDGKWVAYTVSTRIESTNDNTSEVWLAAFDGSMAPTRISAEGANATGPRWLDATRVRFGGGGKFTKVDGLLVDG